MTADMNSADAAWGVRNRLDGTWRGCLGNERVSHLAALELEGKQPLLYAAERNPADVMAEDLASIDPEKIVARARG